MSDSEYYHIGQGVYLRQSGGSIYVNSLQGGSIYVNGQKGNGIIGDFIKGKWKKIKKISAKAFDEAKIKAKERGNELLEEGKKKGKKELDRIKAEAKDMAVDYAKEGKKAIGLGIEKKSKRKMTEAQLMNLEKGRVRLAEKRALKKSQA